MSDRKSNAATTGDLTLGDIEEQETWEEHTRERIEQMASVRNAASASAASAKIGAGQESRSEGFGAASAAPAPANMDEGRRSVVAGGLREMASCSQREGVCLSGRANENDADALEDPAKRAPSSIAAVRQDGLRDQAGPHRYRYSMRARLSSQLVSKHLRLSAHRFRRRAALVCDHPAREPVRVEAQDHLFGLRKIQVAARGALGRHDV